MLIGFRFSIQLIFRSKFKKGENGINIQLKELEMQHTDLYIEIHITLVIDSFMLSVILKNTFEHRAKTRKPLHVTLIRWHFF